MRQGIANNKGNNQKRGGEIKHSFFLISACFRFSVVIRLDFWILKLKVQYVNGPL